MMQKILIIYLLLSFSQNTPALPLSAEPSRVVYQMYIRGFWDGSATPDGTGDFAGVAARADYFSELGVDTLLLMPIFSSTGGMGYVPRDFFATEAAYGSQDSFKEMLEALHARNIKVILDAPVNHISWDSTWFLRGSQKNCHASDTAHDPLDPANRYCDFFYFSSDPCAGLPYRNWHKPWDWNRTDCTDVWSFRPGFDAAYHRQDKYYATFSRYMPDLKFYDFEQRRFNEPVVAMVDEFFRFWTGLGADGFRIDAAKHFVEGINDNRNPVEPENLALLRRFLLTARTIKPDVSFLGEIYGGYHEFEPYIPDALDIALDFPFMFSLRDSLSQSYGEPLKQAFQHMENRQDTIRPGNRVVFAGNHDVSRLMTHFRDDARKWKLGQFLPLLTPFIPLIYYGEELGMHGDVKRPDQTSDDEWVRTVYAFPWQGADPSVGFPGGKIPVTGIPDNFVSHNLAVARTDSDSVFHMVKDILQIRKSFGVTNNTRLHVRKDLYGHVIGWNLINEQNPGQPTCIGVLANFNDHDSYRISAVSDHPACSGPATLLWQSGASSEGGLQSIEIGPHGMAVLGHY